MSDSLIINDTDEWVAAFSGINAFLVQHGLPTDNIIASEKEHANIVNNLPALLDKIPDDMKKEAVYLSKFVAGTTIGLFDAALNYVLNEVVVNLRKLASMYGIDLFYDVAVNGDMREFFKTEDDLSGIKDTVLLDTCRKLELISDVVHKKLTHILTMKNDVAVSHHNLELITAFELLGWLQTCVKDVLQDQPSGSALKMKALIDNLKNTTSVMDSSVVESMQETIKQLALPHVNNLLVSTFGMFIDPNSSNLLRRKISEIAPVIWGAASETVKYNLGIKLDRYKNNLEQANHDLGVQYFELVDGLRYQSLPAKIIQMNVLLDQLLDARHGCDNFHHEASIANMIIKYVKTAEDVPQELVEKFTKTLLICRLGKGISYCQGVSPYARQIYDQLINLFDDTAIAWSIIHLFSPEINGLIMNSICKSHLMTILTIFNLNVASEKLNDAIQFLISNIHSAYKANDNIKFLDILKNIITSNSTNRDIVIGYNSLILGFMLNNIGAIPISGIANRSPEATCDSLIMYAMSDNWTLKAGR